MIPRPRLLPRVGRSRSRERIAEIVLGIGLVERHLLAGPFRERRAMGLIVLFTL
jgi:hypothetical protein